MTTICNNITDITNIVTNEEIEITDENIVEAVNLWFRNEEECIRRFGHINRWNTSKVTNMAHLFTLRDVDKIDISGWDFSNVTNVENMFYLSRNNKNDVSRLEESINRMRNLEPIIQSQRCDIEKDLFKYKQTCDDILDMQKNHLVVAEELQQLVVVQESIEKTKVCKKFQPTKPETFRRTQELELKKFQKLKSIQTQINNIYNVLLESQNLQLKKINEMKNMEEQIITKKNICLVNMQKFKTLTAIKKNINNYEQTISQNEII